ncbi:hypothetical protein [Myroides sp.]|uniref:hypothetical protein n=1 Tax=Myroides sp. TaxID=1874736 RepID=UPI003F2A1748
MRKAVLVLVVLGGALFTPSSIIAKSSFEVLNYQNKEERHEWFISVTDDSGNVIHYETGYYTFSEVSERAAVLSGKYPKYDTLFDLL